MSRTTAVRAPISTILLVALLLTFALSAIQKATSYEHTIEIFERMELLSGTLAYIAYYTATIVELVITLCLIFSRTRLVGLGLGIVFILLATAIYTAEWYVHGSIPECGCGLDVLALPSAGIWVLIRNMVIISSLAVTRLIVRAHRLNQLSMQHADDSHMYDVATTGLATIIVILIILHSLVFISHGKNVAAMRELSETLSSSDTGNRDPNEYR